MNFSPSRSALAALTIALCSSIGAIEGIHAQERFEQLSLGSGSNTILLKGPTSGSGTFTFPSGASASTTMLTSDANQTINGQLTLGNSTTPTLGQLKMWAGDNTHFLLLDPTGITGRPTFTFPSTSGVLATVGNALSHFVESTSNVGNSGAPVVRLRAAALGTDVGVVLEPIGLGAISANLADGTVTGGDTRGDNSVDWQTTRSVSSQVASGSDACVAGGTSNTASGFSAAILGGSGNIASGGYSTVLGGLGNVASGSYSTACGANCTAAGTRSFATNRYTIANGAGQFVIGWNNTAIPAVAVTSATFNTADPAFIIGGGSSPSSRSNSFLVTYDGKVSIGGNSVSAATPATNLDVNGGMSVYVNTKTSDYTATGSDYMILADATNSAMSITLPVVTNKGQIIVVTKTDASANSVVVVPDASTISGAPSYTLTARYNSVTLIADGVSTWYVTAHQ